VTVRGRFGELAAARRADLAAAQPDHDIFVSAYTEDGTLTYDDRLDFFNMRFEVRVPDDAGSVGPPDQEAAERGLAMTEARLAHAELTHRGLKANVVDMASVWDD